MLDAVLTPTRSWLFTPATRPDRFAKAAASGADVAILDLEDAVAPGDKDQARDTALRYLKSRGPEGARHALRINGLDKRAGLRDLVALLDTGVTAIDAPYFDVHDAVGLEREVARVVAWASRLKPPFIRVRSIRSTPL